MLNIIVANSEKGSILNKPCYEIKLPEEHVSAGIIITSLKEILDATPNAIGIAAPQVGFTKQIALINKSITKGEEHMILINPTVKSIGPDAINEFEGCLSFPGLSKKVKRSKNIVVTAFTSPTASDKVSFKASGDIARVIQHEVDHLNGVTILNK